MDGTSDSKEIDRKATKSDGTRLAVLLTLGVLLGLLLGLVLVRASRGGPLFGPPPLHGLEVKPAAPLDFRLTAHTGETVSLSDFRGKPVLLYFGYTYCPDVCPATMTELKWMMKELGSRADEVQVIMISVDPERDIPTQLSDYVTHFHPSFVGLTGTENELAQVREQMGIYVSKHEGTAVTGYLVDHTATVQGLDKNGRLRLLFPFGTTGEEMASDLLRLLRD
jgi:protein SCO1